MSEHIEVSTVNCHVWSDIVFKWIQTLVILRIHTRKLIIIDCSSVWTSPVFVAFHQELFIWRRLTQTCYFFSESQLNLRRTVCVSPPLLNTISWKPVTYPRNMRRSNGTAIRGNDGSCSSVVQRSHDSNCSDWNLPSCQPRKNRLNVCLLFAIS